MFTQRFCAVFCQQRLSGQNQHRAWARNIPQGRHFALINVKFRNTFALFLRNFQHSCTPIGVCVKVSDTAWKLIVVERLSVGLSAIIRSEKRSFLRVKIWKLVLTRTSQINQIIWGICSAQYTEEQRPAAHYNNKMQENKTESNLKFAIKRTTIQISLQLSFESSSGTPETAEK